METFEQSILLDVLSIALVALAFGLLVHFLLRRRNPELGWGALGNVWTLPFGRIDLLIVGVILGLIYVSVRVSGADTEGVPEEDAEMGVTAAWVSVTFMLYVLSALLIYIGFVRGRNLREVFGLERLGPRRVAGFAVVAMLVTYPVVYLVTQGVNLFLLRDTLGDFETQDVVRIFSETKDAGLKLALVFSTCLVAPVVEETLFRGYFYPVVKRYTDRSFSALFTSTVFAVVHMNVLSLAPLLALAVCFTVAYEVTGCLWVPIAMHAIFNTVNVVLILTFPDLL